MIVVIDGPAGSGKSSTAKAVAEKLDIQYLDSGALYRAATLIYNQSNRDRKKFFDTLNEVNISFNYSDAFFNVYVNGDDVSTAIRSQDVNNSVSTVAAMPDVRAFINELMHEAVLRNHYIADGRDLGTAVFPNAQLKFFMIADLEVRAQRRLKEMGDTEVTLQQVQENIASRDNIDSNRDSDPLKKAADAIEIDTTSYSFEEQVAFICEQIRPHLEAAPKQ